MWGLKVRLVNPPLQLPHLNKKMENFKLYNGEVILQYEPQRHIYSVKDKIVYGTTSIIGILDKPALMYWAVNQAVEFLQENLKPGKALDEVEIKTLLDTAKFAHRAKKDKSADIGTMIHEWLEKYVLARINKQPLPEKPINKEMRSAIDGFFTWAKENKVALIASEQKIYSKKYRYAGTLDLEAMVNGKRTIVDFKTSNAIYPEMFLQATAYLMAREEETGRKYNGGVIILRLSKENPKKKIVAFEAQKINSDKVAEYKKVFLSCLNVYRWKMALKKEELLKVMK